MKGLIQILFDLFTFLLLGLIICLACFGFIIGLCKISQALVPTGRQSGFRIEVYKGDNLIQIIDMKDLIKVIDKQELEQYVRSIEVDMVGDG